MRRTSSWLLIVGCLMLAIVGVASASPRAAAQNVEIKGFAFNPASITVNVGDSITWTNNDSLPHTATASDKSFDTGKLDPGASGSVTFSTAGTFAYVCLIHPRMQGTVIVQAAAVAPLPRTGAAEQASLWLVAAGALGLLALGALLRRRMA